MTTAFATSGPERQTRVFISYSRKDGAFAERLRGALTARQFEAYLDKHDIAPGEPWQERLSGLIATADAVAICLSPNFVASQICDWEVNEAERLGKRLLPVVPADTPDADIPQRLKRLNYVFLRHEEEFESGLKKLVAALNTDISWIRDHTRLGERAKEWRVGGEKAAALLRGEQIAQGEAWLAGRPREAPEITEDIARFIAESRAADTAQQKRARRRSRIVAAASLTAAVVMGGLGWLMYGQWLEAQSRQSLTLANYADQQVAQGNAVVAMLLALEALPDDRSLRPLERLRPLVPEAGVSLHRAFHAGAGKWNLVGHAKRVTSARLSPDSSYIATASEDGSARIWSVATGRQHAALVGHHGPITALEFSRDSRLLATGSVDRTVRIWDWRAAKLRSALIGHRAEIERLAFDSSGTRLLSVAKDSAARVWSLATGEPLVEATNDSSVGKPLRFDQAMFTPDGSLLTVGGVSKAVVRIWDASSGYAPRELFKPSDEGQPALRISLDGARVPDVRISPDGARVAVATGGRRLKLWDTATGAEVGTLDAQGSSRIWRVQFSPDGSRLAVEGFSETIGRASHLSILDAQSGNLLCSTPAMDGGMHRFEFDASGRRLFRSDISRPMSVWDASTCVRLADFDSRISQSVNSSADSDTTRLADLEPSGSHFAVAPDGSRVVSWSSSAVAVWDVASGSQATIIRVDGRHNPWAHIALDPAGRTAVAFDSSNEKLDIVETTTGRQANQIDGHGDSISSPLFTPDGKRLVAYGDRSVTIWDTQTWTRLGTPLKDERQIYSVTLSHDGSHVLVRYQAAPDDAGAEEDSLGDKVARLGRVFSVADGREVALRAGDETRHWAQLNSPDGKRDYRQKPGKNAEIFDVQSGKAIADLGGHFGAVSLSADKTRLVTAGDKTASVWEFATGKLVSEIEGGSEWIFLNLAISLDGRRVVTGPNFAGAREAVVGMGPDGRPLASGADRLKALWLWNADTGEMIRALEGHTDSIVHNSMSPAADRLITMSRDGTARIWRLETGALEGVLDLADAELGSRSDVDNAGAAFDVEGQRVLTWAKSGAALWQFFPSLGALVDGTRAAVPRCLTPEERSAFFLSATVPRWCYALRKWPYHDHANTPPPSHTLEERVLLIWKAVGGDAALAAASRAIDWMHDKLRRALPAPSSSASD